VREALGVTVAVRVNVAMMDLVEVTVVRAKVSLVLVGVGAVIVAVKTPEYTVAGGNVVEAVVVMAVVSVAVLVGAVMVVVVWTGVDAVTVVVGTSGARLLRIIPAARRLRSRFSLAAAIRWRAYSTSTARSCTYLRMRGMVVGVTSAAG
jgi:hypothetical protein